MPSSDTSQLSAICGTLGALGIVHDRVLVERRERRVVPVRSSGSIWRSRGHIPRATFRPLRLVLRLHRRRFHQHRADERDRQPERGRPLQHVPARYPRRPVITEQVLQSIPMFHGTRSSRAMRTSLASFALNSREDTDDRECRQSTVQVRERPVASRRRGTAVLTLADLTGIECSTGQPIPLQPRDAAANHQDRVICRSDGKRVIHAQARKAPDVHPAANIREAGDPRSDPLRPRRRRRDPPRAATNARESRRAPVARNRQGGSRQRPGSHRHNTVRTPCQPVAGARDHTKRRFTQTASSNATRSSTRRKSRRARRASPRPCRAWWRTPPSATTPASTSSETRRQADRLPRKSGGRHVAAVQPDRPQPAGRKPHQRDARPRAPRGREHELHL